MRSIHLINSAFLSLKIIVDTQTDVGNAKHQNITSKISKLKHRHISLTLLSDANVPVGFRAQRSTAHISSMYSSSKVSPTLFQTELRITDHTARKFSPSLTLLSVQNSNRMASRFTKIASFPSIFLQLLQCSRQHPSFSAHWAALMTKTDLNYPAFP